MHRRKWVVYLFDPYYVGQVFVPTRRQGRNLLIRLRVEGFSGHVTRTE